MEQQSTTIDKRQTIIAELKGFFHIKELVCNHTYAKFGERSWQFLDTELLETLLFLRRDLLKVPLVCNTSTLKQRGLRCNMCQIVKDKTAAGVSYLSAHVNGAGLDLSSAKMTAQQMRQLIIANAKNMPHKCRIEKDVNWLHIDIFDDPTYDGKVKQFVG